MTPQRLQWQPYLEGLPDRVPDSDLARLEQRSGVCLPEDYRQVVRSHAGQSPEPGTLPVGRGSVPFGVLLLPMVLDETDPNHSYTVEAQWTLLREWAGAGDLQVQRLVPVADTTGHALICLDDRADPAALALVDLDHPPDDPRAITTVADSFEQLLSRLVD